MVVKLLETQWNASQKQIARFWLSSTSGVVVSDNKLILKRLSQDGIKEHYSKGGGQVYPADGNKFLKALPFHFSGSILRAVKEG